MFLEIFDNQLFAAVFCSAPISIDFLWIQIPQKMNQGKYVFVKRRFMGVS